MKPYKTEYFTRIEACIRQFSEERGTVPTLQEMSDALHIPLTTLHRYIRLMQEKGLLEYGGTRRMKLAGAESGGTVQLAVPGRVSCGLPKYAEENIEECLRLPAAWFAPGEYFALWANGDSMRNAGIQTGDLVLLRRQSTAEPGQIVSALIGGEEATLKRYFPRKEAGCIDLVPENEAFPVRTVYPDRESFAIQGVAVKVLKDLE